MADGLKILILVALVALGTYVACYALAEEEAEK